MRKIYFSTYLIVFLSLFITACSNNDSEMIVDTDNTAIEPDFLKNDGSEGLEEEQLEEEAPTETALKTYGYYNYKLLKPSELEPEDICGDSKTMPLLVGSRKKQVGTVDVTNDGDNLYLTFKADDYKYMKKVYLYIGEKGSIPFYSNGFPNLRKFNYKAFPYYYGGQKEATYVIPLSSIDLDCFEIVAYAKVFDKKSWCYYSSFAYDSNLNQKYGYSYYSGCYYYKDWVRSFEYCKQDCEDNCVEIYGKKYKPNTFSCLNSGDQDRVNSVWSNKLAYVLWFDSNRHDLDLFANDVSCDVTGLSQIGQIQIINNENSDTKLNVSFIISDANYNMTSLSLYMGTEENPYQENGDLKPTVSPSDFYTKEFDSPVSVHDFSIEWLGDQDLRLTNEIHIIASIKVCE